jgi:hypothetical protein
MAQAKLYWDKDNYQVVERILKKGMEFCNDSEVSRGLQRWVSKGVEDGRRPPYFRMATLTAISGVATAGP